MLGVCLGFQVLFERSTEHGEHAGLGRIGGSITRFASPGLIVPHMGWNIITASRPPPLMNGVEDGSHVYFVHSYRPEGVDAGADLAHSEYGGEFVCAVAKDNIAGMQFHPEKSGPVGLRLLHNFLGWNP